MESEARESDGHEAARLLGAWLKHVEMHEKAARAHDEKIVVVLPDAEVSDRRKKAKPPASPPRRPRKRAKTQR